jgi:hypothetical protein
MKPVLEANTTEPLKSLESIKCTEKKEVVIEQQPPSLDNDEIIMKTLETQKNKGNLLKCN